MILPLIFGIIFAYSQASVWDGSNITIAVVEYKRFKNLSEYTGYNVITNSMKYYQLMTGLILDNIQADMVIFPEDGLAADPQYAVEINLNDNPCDLGEEQQLFFVCQLSCAARSYQHYLVVNFVTRNECQSPNQSHNCEQYGYLFHNTDVVFDRNGTVVGIYHKYNLYGEEELDRPAEPKPVTFGTDFGINFGIFTCFDILFKSPAEDLLEKGIDAVIFPTMWFSSLPFLTALQVQQMWSQTHNVKLFASGANDPVRGSGGSGVFDGMQGTILADIIAEGGSQAYIYQNLEAEAAKPSSDEEIDALAREMDDFYLKGDGIEDYASMVLNTGEDFDGAVCYGDTEKNPFCCNFTIKTTTRTVSRDKNVYTYHLVAYSGVRSYDGFYNGGLEICAMVACLNSSLSSCGQRFPKYGDIDWPVAFEEISIKAQFEDNENKTQYPNSLLSSIRPLQASLTTWGVREVNDGEEKLIERTFALVEPQSRILTFAIYGRNFELDSPPNGGGNFGNWLKFSWLLLCTTILLVFARK